jgi:hypothetical protein
MSADPQKGLLLQKTTSKKFGGIPLDNSPHTRGGKSVGQTKTKCPASGRDPAYNINVIIDGGAKSPK